MLLKSKLANIIYVFFHGKIKFFSYKHRKQEKWEKDNSEAPWLVPESVFFLENWLNVNMKGFEFGSGRSTKWFADRVKFYFSIEGNYEWYKKTIYDNKDNIQKGKCKIIYKEVGDQLNIDLEKQKKYSSSLNDFEDGYFDFGLIDGHFRIECIKKSINKIHFKGILIIDNSDAIEGIEVFIKKYKFKKYTNGISETCVLYLNNKEKIYEKL